MILGPLYLQQHIVINPSIQQYMAPYQTPLEVHLQDGEFYFLNVNTQVKIWSSGTTGEDFDKVTFNAEGEIVLVRPDGTMQVLVF